MGREYDLSICSMGGGEIILDYDSWDMVPEFLDSLTVSIVAGPSWKETLRIWGRSLRKQLAWNMKWSIHSRLSLWQCGRRIATNKYPVRMKFLLPYLTISIFTFSSSSDINFPLNLPQKCFLFPSSYSHKSTSQNKLGFKISSISEHKVV